MISYDDEIQSGFKKPQNLYFQYIQHLTTFTLLTFLASSYFQDYCVSKGKGVSLVVGCTYRMQADICCKEPPTVVYNSNQSNLRLLVYNSDIILFNPRMALGSPICSSMHFVHLCFAQKNSYFIGRAGILIIIYTNFAISSSCSSPLYF